MENFPRKHKIAFFGTPRFAANILEILLSLDLEVVFVVTQPSKKNPKGIFLDPPVITTAKKNSIKFLQPAKLKDQQLLELIQENSPDAMLVAAYGKLIPKELLIIPPLGWLNIHASLLPRFRGASPIQAAILNGDAKSGVTLMKIDEGLDTGGIISQKEIDLSPQETTPTLTEKMVGASRLLLEESLLPYLDKKISSTPQGQDSATITKEIKKEDGRIDWGKKASYIERMVRAYQPWPGVFFEYEKKRILLRKAALGPETAENPGTCFFENQRFYIATGNNSSIEVLMLQREGKKALNAKEFLQGNRVKQGDRLK